jgi:hypothetical protein
MEARASITNEIAKLEREGYTVVPDVFSGETIAAMTRGLEAAFAERAGVEASIRGDEGTIYAARNVLELWPEAANVWRVPALTECLAAVLGSRFGLTRVLFFDKPPRQTWALPWHKDLTVAVRDNRLPSRHFGKPTRKAGVPHVEAPTRPARHSVNSLRYSPSGCNKRARPRRCRNRAPGTIPRSISRR